MTEKPWIRKRRYLSYLLRLWQESDGDTPPSDAPCDPPLWRASLQSPQSEESRGFAGLDELFAHLREMTDVAPPVDSFEGNDRRPEIEGNSKED